MPVEGLPDRSRGHRLCRACQRWFLPHEGVVDYPPVRGPASWIFDKLARTLDDESRQHFYCDACHRKLQDTGKSAAALNRTLLVLACLGVLIAVAAYLGWFDSLLPSLHRR